MKYEDGKQVLIGDKVHLDGGITGTVMCSIDDGIYTSEYLESQWEYLKKGVMVFSEQAGLIHYAEWNEDCMLIERSKKQTVIETLSYFHVGLSQNPWLNSIIPNVGDLEGLCGAIGD